jgi:hypothetical protein
LTLPNPRFAGKALPQVDEVKITESHRDDQKNITDMYSGISPLLQKEQ